MTTLVPIDGSQSSLEAVKYAARRTPSGDLLLLYVAPSGRMGDLEQGRFLLENCRRAGQGVSGRIRISTRLEVGDRRDKVSQVAAAEEIDLVVMGALGVNGLPHVDRVDDATSALTDQMQLPVVLVLPTGRGLEVPTSDGYEEDEEAPATETAA